MEKENIFKWKHYRPNIILLIVRGYLRYNLSFRDLVEMMEERGLSVTHTTIMKKGQTHQGVKFARNEFKFIHKLLRIPS